MRIHCRISRLFSCLHGRSNLFHFRTLHGSLQPGNRLPERMRIPWGQNSSPRFRRGSIQRLDRCHQKARELHILQGRRQAYRVNYTADTAPLRRLRRPNKSKMQKSHIGVQVLAYIGLFQITIGPLLVNSPGSHRGATIALMAYELALAILLAFQISRLAKRTKVPPAIRSPRFWTASNAATVITLAMTTAAAWQSHCLPLPVTVAATAILSALARFYCLNRCHWRKSRRSAAKEAIPC